MDSYTQLSHDPTHPRLFLHARDMTACPHSNLWKGSQKHCPSRRNGKLCSILIQWLLSNTRDESTDTHNMDESQKNNGWKHSLVVQHLPSITRLWFETLAPQKHYTKSMKWVGHKRPPIEWFHSYGIFKINNSTDTKKYISSYLGENGMGFLVGCWKYPQIVTTQDSLKTTVLYISNA